MVHRENFKTQKSLVILVSLCFRNSHFYGDIIVFESPVSKRKTGVFKFLQFKERFRTASFSSQLKVDGSPIHRNKARVAHFSGRRKQDGAQSGVVLYSYVAVRCLISEAQSKCETQS